MIRAAPATSGSVSWWLRWGGIVSTPTDAKASLVRRLIGCPSTTNVPAVMSRTGRWANRMPAMTDRAAFPVHRVMTHGPPYANGLGDIGSRYLLAAPH